MSKTDIKIFVLPTEKASNIRNDDGEWCNGNDKICQNTINYQYHHLYATTDETPKDGEYYIYPHLINDGVWKCGKYGVPNSGARKVVATDNKDLWYDMTNYTDDGIDDYPDTLLSKISPEFQIAWVKNMNANTPIVDAMMEMDIVYTLNERFTLDNLDEAEFVSQTEVENEYGTVFPASYLSGSEIRFAPKNYQPKLNSQGYVTILPVKEKMYSKDEVKKLLTSGMKYSSPFNDLTKDMINWIEQNL